MTSTIFGIADRSVVEIAGQDARTFLDATLTQRIADLVAQTWRSALWLDLHGAPLAVMDLVAPDAPADVLLAIVPAELVDVVVDGLGGRTFLADARLQARDDLRVLVVRGEGASDIAAAAGAAEGTVGRLNGVLVLGRATGVDLVVATDDVPAWLERLDVPGARRVDALGLRARDIADGVPGWGCEITAPHLPEEVGLLPTHVHLDKGCYPGQEAVARMWMLGRPRRRLARLDVTGSAIAGSEAGEGRDRTLVTSVAGPHALGFVPPAVQVGDRIDGEGWAAVVAGFVGEAREVVGHNPGMTRRRDRT